jgi:hypothetical protein
MMFILAQIDQALGLTGVIATILAVIFGIAAYYNSRTRKKHLLELERSQKQDQPMHFRPAKSSHPASRSNRPALSGKPHQSSGPGRTTSPRASTPKAAPVAKSSSLPEMSPKKSEKKSEPAPSSSPQKETPQLFRKVRPTGSAEPDLSGDSDEQDEYVWE